MLYVFGVGGRLLGVFLFRFRNAVEQRLHFDSAYSTTLNDEGFPTTDGMEMGKTLGLRAGLLRNDSLGSIGASPKRASRRSSSASIAGDDAAVTSRMLPDVDPALPYG